MTACAIGVVQGDMIVGIYSHTNGEPAHTGAILNAFYDSVRTNTLVRYGDVLELGATIGVTHNSNTPIQLIDEPRIESPVPSETTFYGRDLGDNDLSSEQFFNKEKFKDFYTKHRGAKHSYLRGRNGWTYYDGETDDWVQLADYLQK